MSKAFQPVEFDLEQLARELSGFRQMLDGTGERSEADDVVPFFRRRPQLATQIAAVHLPHEVDRYCHESDLFGNDRCDLAVGDSAGREYAPIEFEDARPDGVFTAGDRYNQHWGRRFRRGFSRLVDWFRLLDRYHDNVDVAVAGSATATSFPTASASSVAAGSSPPSNATDSPGGSTAFRSTRARSRASRSTTCTTSSTSRCGSLPGWPRHRLTARPQGIGLRPATVRRRITPGSPATGRRGRVSATGCCMSDPLPPGLFDAAASFDPAGDLDAFARQVPARWVVYLLADEHDRPVQLLCVRNLRASLKRRLGLGEDATATEPSRRVDYRALVRRVHWRRVDSSFEADWHYYEAARHLFPGTYAGMVGFRPAWFVHVDPDAEFPRYVRTTDLTPRPGLLVGPIENKQQAAALVELMEDAFDLCRYYNILVQAPNGQACAYKEMGKCPAPCDGSVSVGQYRRLVEWSGRVLVDPADAVREQTRRMRQAAGELRFETAGKIKAYVDQLSKLGVGPFRHVAAAADFQYLSIQRGPRSGTAKIALVTPGRIEPLLSVVGDGVRPAEVMRAALTTAADRPGIGTDPVVAGERVGIVAHHLFAPAKRASGVFLPLTRVDEKAIAKAVRDVARQAAEAVPADDADEGVMKELQAS